MKNSLIFLLFGITIVSVFSSCSNSNTQLNNLTQESNEVSHAQLIESPQNAPKEITLVKEKIPDIKIFDTGLMLRGANATQIIYSKNFSDNDEKVNHWYVTGSSEIDQPTVLESLQLSSFTQENKGVQLIVERFHDEKELNRVLDLYQNDIVQYNLIIERKGAAYMAEYVKDKSFDLMGNAEQHPAWKNIEPSQDMIFFGFYDPKGYGYSLSSFYNVVKRSEQFFTKFSETDRKNAENFMKLIEYPFVTDKAENTTVQINHEGNTYTIIFQLKIDSKNQETKYQVNLSQAFLILKQLQEKGLFENITMSIRDEWLRFVYKIDESTMRQIIQ